MTTKPPYFRTDIAFDGQSIVRLKDNLVDLDELNKVGTVTIRLEFTTTASNGLILWKGQRLPEYDFDEYLGPYLAIAGETNHQLRLDANTTKVLRSLSTTISVLRFPVIILRPS